MWPSNDYGYTGSGTASVTCEHSPIPVFPVNPTPEELEEFYFDIKQLRDELQANEKNTTVAEEQGRRERETVKRLNEILNNARQSEGAYPSPSTQQLLADIKAERVAAQLNADESAIFERRRNARKERARQRARAAEYAQKMKKLNDQRAKIARAKKRKDDVQAEIDRMKQAGADDFIIAAAEQKAQLLDEQTAAVNLEMKEEITNTPLKNCHGIVYGGGTLFIDGSIQSDNKNATFGSVFCNIHMLDRTHPDRDKPSSYFYSEDHRDPSCRPSNILKHCPASPPGKGMSK